MARYNRIRWLALILAGLMFLSGCSGGDGGTTQPEEEGFGSLICVEYSSFTGTFPEDGTGRRVTDVAAMLVHNSSSEFLDYATVECIIGDETGTFEITGLPPGASAWVLERDAKTLAEGDHFQAHRCQEYSYRDDAILSADQLSVKAEGNTLTVTNRSEQTLENVCVYYKTVYSDGNYFGGITYMLSFGTLEPGGSAQKQSSHFGSDSRIVRYSFQES